MTGEARRQRGRFSMRGSGGTERRRRQFIFVVSILFALIFVGKALLPQQTIHYAMDSLQSYTNTSLKEYLIPLAPLHASVLPGDTLSGQRSRPTLEAAASLNDVGGLLPPEIESSVGDGEILSPFDVSASSKVAVMIENRIQKSLIPLILHFASVLGPEWPIIIYTNTESLGMFASSAAFDRYRKTGRIQIRLLPITVLFTNYESINSFLTKPW